jgi:hypothetical protein
VSLIPHVRNPGGDTLPRRVAQCRARGEGDGDGGSGLDVVGGVSLIHRDEGASKEGGGRRGRGGGGVMAGPLRTATEAKLILTSEKSVVVSVKSAEARRRMGGRYRRRRVPRRVYQWSLEQNGRAVSGQIRSGQTARVSQVAGGRAIECVGVGGKSSQSWRGGIMVDGMGMGWGWSARWCGHGGWPGE